MAKSDTPAARAPRGTKPVSQAFFTALEQVPEPIRAAVGKAAVAMIRDEMKTRRDKLKLAAAKEKARKPAAPARAPKPAAAKTAPAKPTRGKPVAAKSAPEKTAPEKTASEKPASEKPAVAKPASPKAPAKKALHLKANGTAEPAPAKKGRPRKTADVPTGA